MTPEKIRERMLALEKRHGDDHSALDVVAGRILGIEPTEEFMQSLSKEVDRTLALSAEWYGVRVAVLPNPQAIAVAVVQGITFAVAALEEEGKL